MLHSESITRGTSSDNDLAEETDPLLPQRQANDSDSFKSNAYVADEIVPYHRTLLGFLSYSAAAETFSIVSVALFLPICLEAFARDHGRLTHHPDQSCKLPGPDTPQGDSCEVQILGRWINTSSFSLLTYSASVLSQAIVFITLGSQANHPATRKAMLFTSAFIGSVSQILLLALKSDSPIWVSIALLSIIGNVAFGLGNVCLNAYLPVIAKSSPDVIAKAPFINESAEQDLEYKQALSKSAGFVSALGVGTGYSVGVGALLLCLLPVLRLRGSIDALRIAIALSGISWLVLSLPAFYLLESRSSRPRESLSWSKGWIGLAHVFKEAKHLRHTMQYLLAYIFLSDAFATIMSTATLFAKTEVHMEASKLIVLGILAPCCGVIGAFLIPVISARFGFSNHQTLLGICCVAAFVPAYGCLALIFHVQPGHFASLTTNIEVYGLASLFGLLYGAFQSYSRALYSELIPKGEEARFFSLYAITDKSSSFLGPFLVALIADHTNNLRFGFLVILLGLTLPLPFLFNLNVEAGREAAASYIRRDESAREQSRL